MTEYKLAANDPFSHLRLWPRNSGRAVGRIHQHLKEARIESQLTFGDISLSFRSFHITQCPFKPGFRKKLKAQNAVLG